MAGEETTNNVRQEIGVGRIGLDLDSSVNQIGQGKLSYALNAALENFDNNTVNYQNEQGNDLCITFPEDFQLIGSHFIPEQTKHIFFLSNPLTGESEIGYMQNNDCVYRKVINANCLNFSINHPIHKSVHKITNCTTEIYWTDGYNERRFIDLENLPYKILEGTDVCDNVTTTEVDCNKLRVMPQFSIPNIAVTDVVSGGELLAGTYQFAIQYCTANGDGYTSYYSVTNPTPIANPDVTSADFNYPVGKSIVLNVTNIDVQGYFEYYNVAVIKTINGITSVQVVGTYFIDDSSKQITYTGQGTINLTINDIFEKFAHYEIAQDVTAVQDVLVWSDLTSVQQINYQKIANKINLQWESWRIPSTENYEDELNATNLRGYLRDEVYAFEIVFLLKNGKQTDGFHIPGRAIDLEETSHPDIPNTNADFIGEPTYYNNSVGYSPYWKIYNTATVSGNSPGYSTAKTYKGPYQYGKFAYWESTETYPCNEEVWGELSNQPIRHHKFPDLRVSPIFESPTIEYGGDGKYKLAMTKDAIYPIGVKIDNQQVIDLIEKSSLTTEQKSDIVGFKIVRGDRSTNKSILAKGIIRNVGKYDREGTTYYFPNYPYNDLREDPFLLTKSNSFYEQCNPYAIKITAVPGMPSTAGSYTYTDCNTGLTATGNILSAGTYEVCSLTKPVISNATGGSYISKYTKYKLKVGTFIGNRFGWTDPEFGYKTEWFNWGLADSNYYVNSTTYPVNITNNSGSSISKVEDINPNINCSANNIPQLTPFSDNESKQRFVFNSPETSFGQPFLGNILKLENVIFGAGKAHFVEVKKHALYKMLTKEAQQDALKSSVDIANITTTFDPTAMFTAYQAYIAIYINGITRRNFAYSYNSVVTYDYHKPIENNIGIKQRKIDIAQYVIPGVQSVNDNYTFNNYQRESSVYVKTNTTLPFAEQTPSILLPGNISAVIDNSKNTLNTSGNCYNPNNQFDINSVLYYASMKNENVNQWGQMYSYNTIETGYQKTLKDSSTTIFGGDTFIGKFALKTKLPFFIDNRVGANDDSDIFYDEIGNVAYPKYWFSSRSILSNYVATYGSTSKELKNIISVKAHNFDCPNSQTAETNNPDRTFYNGKMYLFAYGIPYFYCESSINVDLRQAFNNKEGDFYPHVSSGIPDDWLQESNVSIANDNTYWYNTTYSKQNKENYFSHLPVNWSDKLCYTVFPFRAIYSDKQATYTDNTINNWIIYRPASMFDFPQNYGKLTSLDGIQNRAILARFENKSLLYNTLLTIDTSNPQAAYVGNDTLFKSAPPIDFAETDIGYVGSQHKFLLKIPHGQITVDAKRGQVFLISGQQVNDLSGFGSGMNRFLTDHLQFEILRYFPNVNIDNHFKGIGLHGIFDSKFDRVIISKLDYLPLSDEIYYNETDSEFYIDKTYGTSVIPVKINVTDSKYFCNKSWTLSYNFNTNSWISFHSYIPNWYIAENNFFYSGLNSGVDLEAIAIEELPQPTTTSTTSTSTSSTSTTSTTTVVPINYCVLAGVATSYYPGTTTTTSSTSSSTTTSTTTIASCAMTGNAILV